MAVVDGDARAIATVDPATGTVVAVVPVPLYPGAPTSVPASGELVVPIGTYPIGALLAVDEAGSAVRARLDLDFYPGRCALTPGGATLYVCDPANGLVHRIDPVAVAPVGEPIAVDDGGVSDVAVGPTGELLHVVGVAGLWTLDTGEHAAVGDPVPLPGGASDMALTMDGRRAAVVLYDADSIAVVELRPAE